MAQKCSNAISNGKPLMEQLLVHTRSQDAQELVSLSCSSWFSKPHTKPRKVCLLKRKESTGMEDPQDAFVFDEVDLDFCFQKGRKKAGQLERCCSWRKLVMPPVLVGKEEKIQLQIKMMAT
ncbi:unnamed protein product [Sphagnum jensenii]|uniref:Uncharacterized protein n=1 Tax=Sphagnum jensenii TaxID=128206 RepID=A0ABP1C0B0_9BRYO